jgi:protease-4
MKVAEGRGMTTQEVDRIGRGRVWTGVQAKELGLVDDLGGLDTAVRLAKEKAGIAAETNVQLVFYPKAKRLLEVLIERFRGQIRVPFKLPMPLQPILPYLAAFDLAGGKPLLLMPLRMQVQ